MVWKLFEPSFEKLKEKKKTNRLIKILRSKDIKLCKRAASALGEIGDGKAIEPLIRLFCDPDVVFHNKADSALGEIVAHIGAESAINTICALIDHGSLKTLGFKKTLDENILLSFQKSCHRCKKHSGHKYYVKTIRLFRFGKLVYNGEFRYIKCDNCGRSSKLLRAGELIDDLIIDSKVIAKINSIIPDQGFSKLPDRATFFDFNQLLKEVELSELDKDLINIVQRIKIQVIDGESNQCYYCGNIVHSTTGRRCSFCNLIVCNEHILPEQHGCKGKFKPSVGIAYTRKGKAQALEGRLSSE